MRKKTGPLVLLILLALALPLMANAEMQTGQCGNNLTYTLTDGGILTISGTGSMFNYNFTGKNGYLFTSAPWGKSPKKLTIKEGVINIGKYAFYGCRDLTSVIIPDTITTIGEFAFESCTSLTSVTIPTSVTSIGRDAFCNDHPTIYCNKDSYADSWATVQGYIVVYLDIPTPTPTPESTPVPTTEPTPTPEPTATPEPEKVPGDINGDGTVDGRDLLRLARYMAGDGVTVDMAAADVNGDGNVDGRDVLRLAKQLAGG